MTEFKDNRGRTWRLEINVSTARRVRARLSFDLLTLLNSPDEIHRLAGDPYLLADVLFVLCEEQAKQVGVTDEDFGAALAGDPIDHATKGLLRALVDFCPSPSARGVLGRIIEAAERLGEEALARIEEQLPEEGNLILQPSSSSPTRPSPESSQGHTASRSSA